MDYRNYKDLMERYHELSAFIPNRNETEDGLIKKLMNISYEKKQIFNEANDIIRECIEKYEKDLSLLDKESADMLNDFLLRITLESGYPLDLPISLRILRLLLSYYQSVQDLERIVNTLDRCANYDIMMQVHTGDWESSPYSLMAELYLDDFDRLSDDGKHRLARCWVICMANQKDRTFGLKKYREIRERFVEFRQKMGEDFILDRYVRYEAIALDMAIISCLRAEYAQKSGITLTEPVIDLEKDAPMMEEIKRHLSAVLARKDAAEIMVGSRVYSQICILRADYHLGNITIEEMLARVKECSKPQEDDDAMGQIHALFDANAYYLEYLYKCSGFDRQYVQDEGRKVVDHILGRLGEISLDIGSAFDSFYINYCLIEFISAASGMMEFDLFKSTVLNATVYADKALYVHTMMVREICLVILDYILDHDPAYLDGVAGKNWEYCRDHKDGILDLMENCALFHDIGKYFCIDTVSNSSRRLTDDEFKIIKHHPLNFSTIYQGGMTPEIECIRDCSLLHHLWYNEKGGYPRERHTANKPFVNILTIADCIDAATDNIGRPYGFGKTLEDLLVEFDADKEVRYSGYISELLHVEEIQRKINHVIYDRRKEIYCDIYLYTP